jgi:hypothetical protein
MVTKNDEIIDTLKGIRAELVVIRELLQEIARQCRRHY